MLVLQLHLSLLNFTPSAAEMLTLENKIHSGTRPHEPNLKKTHPKAVEILQFGSISQSADRLPFPSPAVGTVKKCFVNVFQRITVCFSWCEFVCQCLTCEQRASEAW